MLPPYTMPDARAQPTPGTVLMASASTKPEPTVTEKNGVAPFPELTTQMKTPLPTRMHPAGVGIEMMAPENEMRTKYVVDGGKKLSFVTALKNAVPPIDTTPVVGDVKTLFAIVLFSHSAPSFPAAPVAPS
jgi:hypothetical protein